jgi:hypothetical protein
MRRSAYVALVAASLAGVVTTVAAQGASPDPEDGRYTFKSIDDGYLRLDGRTGQVSLCTRRTVGWACQAVPDERTALEGEIARLQGENVALKKELLAHNLPLPGAIKPEPPAAKNEGPGAGLPADADFNKMVAFVEKVWRRMVEMIESLQKDVLKQQGRGS